MTYRIYDPVDGDYVGSLTYFVDSKGGNATVMEDRYAGKRILGR